MNEKNRLHEESVQAAERIVARQDIVVSDHEFRLMRLAWLAGYGAGMAYVKSATDAAFAELDRRIG